MIRFIGDMLIVGLFFFIFQGGELWFQALLLGVVPLIFGGRVIYQAFKKHPTVGNGVMKGGVPQPVGARSLSDDASLIETLDGIGAHHERLFIPRFFARKY